MVTVTLLLLSLVSLAVHLMISSIRLSLKAGFEASKSAVRLSQGKSAFRRPTLSQATTNVVKGTAKATWIAQKTLLRILIFLHRVLLLALSVCSFVWMAVLLCLAYLLFSFVGSWHLITHLYEGNPSYHVIQSLSSQSSSSSSSNNHPGFKTGELPPVANKGNIGITIAGISAQALSSAPSGCYLYQQGDSDYCHYDCSTWVVAHVEEAGWQLNEGSLVEREGDRYIIGKNRKSDLHAYHISNWFDNTPIPGTAKGLVSDYDQLKPGDIISHGYHIAIYYGKINGKHIISHASGNGVPLFKDPELTQPTTDVGFQEIYTPEIGGWNVTRLDDAK